MSENSQPQANGQTSENADTPEAQAESLAADNAVDAKNSLPAGVSALSALLGEITFLLSSSPAHRLLFLADLDWLVVPPVKLNQFRLVRRDGKPIAYVSWALLNEEVEARIAGGAKRLKPDEWTSGDRPWIIDLVAPFGNSQVVIDNLAKSIFEGKEFKGLISDENGKIKVKSWKN